MKEFYEWMIYASIQPFNHAREDWRMGQVCATIINSNPWRKRGAKLYEAQDFMHGQKKIFKRLNNDEMKRKLMKWTVFAGGKIECMSETLSSNS